MRPRTKKLDTKLVLNSFEIFRWGNFFKVLKFYLLLLAIFWITGWKLFKVGYYSREDIKQGNAVYVSAIWKENFQETYNCF